MLLHAGEYDIAGVELGTVLQQALGTAPRHSDKHLWVERELDRFFQGQDWSKSFDRTQVIVFNDLISSELLVIMHYWFRKHCANIENILLIVTLHQGIEDWWQQWCDTHHEKSFRIQELFFFSRPVKAPSLAVFFNDRPALDRDRDFFIANKQISKLFSYYGGSYSRIEREYLILSMLRFRHCAEIDFMGELSPKDDLLQWLEHMTYYRDQPEIDRISTMHDWVLSTKPFARHGQWAQAKKDEMIDYQGLQWQTDRRCWACVVRETVNSDHYPSVTEKTIRAFLHHCVVIPLGYRAVQSLERVGFWFPHDMVDYSYQSEPLFIKRIQALTGTLEQLSSVPYAQLQQYYLDNFDRFQYNIKVLDQLEKQPHFRDMR